MPGSSRSEGARGTIHSGAQNVAEIRHWSMEHIGQGRFSFVADLVDLHPVHWQFRNKSKPLKVELPHKRQTLWFSLELSSENPLSGEATLDANNAEEAGEFW